MAHDVFICHATQDKSTADAVCSALESSGIRCWIAPRDVAPGVDWGAAIIDAINGCRVMILVFSKNANESVQIKREVERAVSKGVSIIPFRIEDVLPTKSMEYFIGSVHWLDALTPPLAKHLQKLAAAAKALLNSGPQSPVSVADTGSTTAAPRARSAPLKMICFAAVGVLAVSLAIIRMSPSPKTTPVASVSRDTNGPAPPAAGISESLYGWGYYIDTEKSEVVFQFDPGDGYPTNYEAALSMSPSNVITVAGPFNGWSRASDWMLHEVDSNFYELRKPIAVFKSHKRWPFKYVINRNTWVTVEPPLRSTGNLMPDYGRADEKLQYFDVPDSFVDPNATKGFGEVIQGYRLENNEVIFEFRPKDYAWLGAGWNINRVSLLGDINNWHWTTNDDLTQGADGTYTYRRNVKDFQGKHVWYFRYQVNGQWVSPTPAAKNFEINPNGSVCYTLEL